MAYWLFKSEPGVWSWDMQKAKGKDGEEWTGVRNYQARNMLRDQMKKGDLAFFYHSNCAEPGIVGIMRIACTGYPDSSAFDPNDVHYDPKSAPDAPRWYRVDVRYQRKLRRIITLAELKEHPELTGMGLLARGNRLSVMPVTGPQWDFILSLE